MKAKQLWFWLRGMGVREKNVLALLVQLTASVATLATAIRELIEIMATSNEELKTLLTSISDRIDTIADEGMAIAEDIRQDIETLKARGGDSDVPDDIRTLAEGLQAKVERLAVNNTSLKEIADQTPNALPTEPTEPSEDDGEEEDPNAGTVLEGENI